MNNIIDTGIMKEIVINNNKYKSTSITILTNKFFFGNNLLCI